MLAISLINETLMPLRRADTVAAAREFMAEQGITELPVLDNKHLYNYVRASMLIGLKPQAKLEDVLAYNPHAPRVGEKQHIYEVVPVFAAADLHVLVVVNESGEFIGILDEKNIHKSIAQSLTYKGVGAILVLRCDPKDFAPSHIARLVEENGAKILGMMVYHTESGMVQVNIKINSTIVKGIVASLERFGFKVADVYLSEDHEKNNNREYDSVLRFFDL